MTAILALKASVALALALGIAERMRRRNPALAHLVLGLGFLAVLLLPLADAALPSWRVPLLPPAQARPEVLEPVDSPENQALAKQAPLAVRRTALIVTPPTRPATNPLPFLWTLGVAAIVLRALVGTLALGRLRWRGSVPIRPGELPLDAVTLADRAGLRRSVKLCRALSAQPAGPLTWGALRPVVLLPAESVHWPAPRLEAALLHEFAHVRRGDAALGLLTEIVCAFHWFNPLAWLGARWMREAAELAADLAVLRSGVRPADYAAELLRLAAEIRRSPSLLTGVQAMNAPKIEPRLRAVLAAGPSSPGLTARHALLAGLATLAAVPALAALRPVALQTDQGRPDRTEALWRAKNLGAGTVIYAQDYDDHLPTGQSTAVASYQILPYARSYARKNTPNLSDAELFRSPVPGGRFLFNTKVAGLSLVQVESPAETLAWFETLPDPSAPVAVAYLDGHAQTVDPARRDALRGRIGTATSRPRRPDQAAALARLRAAEAELIAARAALGTPPPNGVPRHLPPAAQLAAVQARLAGMRASRAQIERGIAAAQRAQAQALRAERARLEAAKRSFEAQRRLIEAERRVREARRAKP